MTILLEGSVMEYVKWFVMIASIFFISIVVIMMFRMNEVNSFQQEVNYQIERHGGLTDSAIADLDNHVKDAYGSCVVELDASGNEPSSIPEECENPFYIKEYIDDEGTAKWHKRGDVKASFGTQINYAIVRHVGSIGETPIVKPSVLGTSASRVRGD